MASNDPVLIEYWFTMFPSLKIFEEYVYLYFNHGNKSWQERWDFTLHLLENIKTVMHPYHELSKEDQKLPEELKKIRFLRAQCVVVQTIRSQLVIDQQRGKTWTSKN